MCVLAAALVLLLASGPAAAAFEEAYADLTGLSLEELMQVEIVVAASKHEQDPMTAPSSVSIITAEEIRLYGYRTLADALASVRGFYTAYDRNYHYVGVRGVLRPGDFGSRLLILIDGYRVNDPLYNQGPVGGEFPLDLALVERIEVVRGPGSSLYGTNALFAVVNVVTRDASDAPAAEIAAAAAGGGMSGGRITAGRANPAGAVLVSGSLSDSDGRTLHFDEYDEPGTNNGYADNDFESAGRAFARVARGCFSVEAAYSSRTKGIPTGAWGMVFDDDRNQAVDKMGFVDLEWHRGVPETLAVTACAHHGAYTYEGDYTFADGDGTTVNHDVAEGRWWGGELLVVRRLGGAHLVSAGGEYQDNFRLDQRNFDDGSEYLDSRESSRAWGVYLQDEMTVARGVTLHAGVRYDHYTTFGGDWNPRLSVVYSPTERTAVKLLYGGAFRAPSPYELYYHDGFATQKPNPELGPESVTSYEAVLEHRLGRAVGLTVSAFVMTLDDIIGLCTDPLDSLLVYGNMGEAESRGVEVELERRATRGWRGRVSYSYQDARDLSTDERLTGSPRHLAKLHVSAPLAGDGLLGALEVQYIGDRPTVRGAVAEDCVLVNADVLAGGAGAWTLSAGVDNMFDEKRLDPGSEEHDQETIEQDGRTLHVGLSYTFQGGRR